MFEQSGVGADPQDPAGRTITISWAWYSALLKALPKPWNGSGEVSSHSRLIAIDRSVDIISVLCSQLSYAGIVEEVFGSLALGAHAVAADGELELPFTVGDPVWESMQDLQLDAAREMLGKWASELRGLQDEFADLKARKAPVSELREFVDKKLPRIQTETPLWQAHKNLLEKIHQGVFNETTTGVRLLDSKVGFMAHW